jgi:hypothetical protein
VQLGKPWLYQCAWRRRRRKWLARLGINDVFPEGALGRKSGVEELGDR